MFVNNQPAYNPGYFGPAYGAPVVASAPVAALTEEERMAQLRGLMLKYELAGGAIRKLRKLENYDIVVIADDSGSMREHAHKIPENSPFGRVVTRWEELCSRVADVVEFATALDKDGIDIYFLNGGTYKNITSPDEARRLFDRVPDGATPLTATYERVLDDKLANPDNKVLILIATDGEPTLQGKGRTLYNDSKAFIECLTSRESPHRCPTSIMACTDEQDQLEWLNELDNNVPYVDVLDDYQSERGEVLKVQGDKFKFTQGDYIVKTLLGPIDEIYDNLDEKKLSSRKLAEYLGQNPSPERIGCRPKGCAIS